MSKGEWTIAISLGFSALYVMVSYPVTILVGLAIVAVTFYKVDKE